jgi:hypothetical protein
VLAKMKIEAAAKYHHQRNENEINNKKRKMKAGEIK